MHNAESFYKLLLDSDEQTHQEFVSALVADHQLREAIWQIANIKKNWPPALLDSSLAEDANDLIQQFSNCQDLELGMCLLPLIGNSRRDCREQCGDSLDGLSEYAG
ncbi:MAG: hypothetical protein HRU15_17150, partial [Planctomycetes bacterium]|nr:hypothetical protein [Planctomycetota bacterium]